MTRWSVKDLTGKLVNAQKEVKADQWDMIEFPAIFPETGNPMWPEYWKADELLSVKASLSEQKWQAQWQQQPTSEEGSIIKRDWWKLYEHEDPPPLQHIIQSYDTAFIILTRDGRKRLLRNVLLFLLVNTTIMLTPPLKLC
jgi:hypothetical protein